MLLFSAFFLIFIFSLLLIFSYNVVHSVFSLISIVLLICMCLFYLEFEFISYMLLIVYIGAVMILMLFLVMLINLNFFFRKNVINLMDNLYLVIICKFFILFQNVVNSIDNKILVLLNNHYMLCLSNIIKYKINDALLFGKILYWDFFPSVWLISIILLVGMIGSISICLAEHLLLKNMLPPFQKLLTKFGNLIYLSLTNKFLYFKNLFKFNHTFYKTYKIFKKKLLILI